MARNVFKIEDGKVGFTLTDPWTAGLTDVCAATAAAFGTLDATCQVTTADISSSQNVNREEIPATWCAEPSSSVASVTDEYTANIEFLLDENQAQGVAAFLMANSGKEAWVYIGADGDDPPKAVAHVRLGAATIFGEKGAIRTARVALAVDGTPAVCFGDATSSVAVGNPPDPLDISADHAVAAAFADLATLKSDHTSGDGSYSGAAFTTGQYITLVDKSKAHYASAAWTAGAATA